MKIECIRCKKTIETELKVSELKILCDECIELDRNW